MVDVFNPQSLEEALSIRRKQPVIPYAGGTDLMVRHRSWSGTSPSFSQPILMVGAIEALKTIQITNNMLEIGAAATLTDLLLHPAVPSVLKKAISLMASPAIRNSATLGGNICNASPAADTVPVLYAANAMVQLQSSTTSRSLPVEAFILGPGKTALGADELLTAVQIPLGHFDLVDYRKVGTRKANALSKLSFIGLARIADRHVSDVRIAFGAVAPTVVRSPDVEALLCGLTTNAVSGRIEDLLRYYARLIVPIDDQRSNAHYRKTVALQLLADFLVQLSGQTT